MRGRLTKSRLSFEAKYPVVLEALSDSAAFECRGSTYGGTTCLAPHKNDFESYVEEEAVKYECRIGSAWPMGLSLAAYRANTVYNQSQVRFQ